MQTTILPQIKKMSPVLVVADIKRSMDFYTKILGFEIEFIYEDFYAGIIKEGHSIHLKTGKPSAEQREIKRKNQDLDIVFSIGNIEAFYEQISSDSGSILQPLRNMDYGKEFYISDPDGNTIAFILPS